MPVQFQAVSTSLPRTLALELSARNHLKSFRSACPYDASLLTGASFSLHLRQVRLASDIFGTTLCPRRQARSYSHRFPPSKNASLGVHSALLSSGFITKDGLLTRTSIPSGGNRRTCLLQQQRPAPSHARPLRQPAAIERQRTRKHNHRSSLQARQTPQCAPRTSARLDSHLWPESRHTLPAAASRPSVRHDPDQ